jgi:hypothetical protein
MLQARTRIIPSGAYVPHKAAIDILITDLAFHAQKPTNPATLVRNLAKGRKRSKDKRTYTGLKLIDDNTIEMSLDFNEQEVLDLLAKQHKRILRIYLPTQGLPASMAPDALEKLSSLQKKHLRQTNRR